MSGLSVPIVIIKITVPLLWWPLSNLDRCRLVSFILRRSLKVLAPPPTDLSPSAFLLRWPLKAVVSHRRPGETDREPIDPGILGGPVRRH